MEKSRLKIVVRGAVQGVGFRPFVYRLATRLGLTGWVRNSPQGVLIEVEGEPPLLKTFLLKIESEKPPISSIQSLESSFLEAIGYSHFVIDKSEGEGEKSTLILPDIAACQECVKEILDPSNRRYLYPFTNCTHCGPRFTIIEKLPYDRPNTAMKNFKMCLRCETEYHDPRDRRFHAQPNACHECGPRLELWNIEGQTLAQFHEALYWVVQALSNGKIVAVKGIGGFHLMLDARNTKAVENLRRLKHREEKPFALLFPNLEEVQKECEVSPLESRLLLSPEAPIVLLRRHASSQPSSQVVEAVAPNNPNLGVFLPYSPLHHLLMRQLNFPLVATSGNLSDEPICIDEREALERLRGIANLFLVHNRPIIRPVDDSIVQVMLGRELVLRRSRGYAPLPIILPKELPVVMGVGAHLKNTVALSIKNQIFVSQHIGNLETFPAFEAFQKAANSLKDLYEKPPITVACDLHPDYLSTQFAHKNFSRVTPVQHHYAHILSCMAENHLEAPVLGIAWDGAGLGLDGTIWGGEFLKITTKGFTRFAHFRTFPLVGGVAAVREPRRTALGLLYEIYGDALFDRKDLGLITHFTQQELNAFQKMLQKKIHSPLTSSVGRLFDGVASLIELRQKTAFEGQAAMEMEFALEKDHTSDSYPFSLSESRQGKFFNPIRIEWEELVLNALQDHSSGKKAGFISAKFHHFLVEVILAVAHLSSETRIVLSGGCFQNRYLVQQAVSRLKSEGFFPFWHQHIPPNDGGIALGQVFAEARAKGKEET